jgi:NhaP-type Na+/H+ or K+/H+ antiporter
VSTDQILLGLGLTVVLAVGAQVIANRLRIPALILLLLFGFAAGAATHIVRPSNLLGPAFQPLVSLAVGLILYNAGVQLNLRKLTGGTRSVVVRLILIGVPLTFVAAGFASEGLFGISRGAALMLGAIVVVSGPTVVEPLLDFVRPVERPQRILSWEGSLIDPLGGILGAVVATAVVAHTKFGSGHQAAAFALSLGIGVAGAVAGVALLWLLVRLGLNDVLATSGQIAVVVGVTAACDTVSDDSGLIGAIAMGLVVANVPSFRQSARQPFFDVLIQLMLGLLFISISATVTPSSLRHLILPTLGLVAFLVFIVRPVVALVSTWRARLSCGERGLIGWMAPRGIVAAATASTFGTDLAQKGIGGAKVILPVTFMVIVGTVTLYGLTAVPVARLLRVTRPARSRPLLVGGQPWVLGLAGALKGAGLDVLMWAGSPDERETVRRTGLPLAEGGAVALAAQQGFEIEGVTTVLLLTVEDDFNALASAQLVDTVDGGVYRVAPPSREHGVVAPYAGIGLLFGEGLTGADVRRRYDNGARILTQPAATELPPGYDLLFVIGPEGQLWPFTTVDPPVPGREDTLVVLSG